MTGYNAVLQPLRMHPLIIGFDGDDTLWHNEESFVVAQNNFRELLEPYCDVELASERLLEAERRNLDCFGYGAKGFALSMIETAIELTDGRISGREMQSIIQATRAILATPATLLDGVEDVLRELSSTHRLFLITKGDLFEQETKIARSGIAHRFASIEIVSEKRPENYLRLFSKHGVRSERFIMVGNSIRSDVLPVLEVGGTAVYIPYHLVWKIEASEEPIDYARFVKLDDIRQLPAYLRST